MHIAANGDISEYQVGKYRPDANNWRFVPSVTADRIGNIAVAYNVSGPTLPAGQYVSSRAQAIHWESSAMKPCSTPATSSTLTTTFTPQHLLSIGSVPSTGGTVTPANGLYYNPGAVVPLVATPAASTTAQVSTNFSACETDARFTLVIGNTENG